MKYKILKDYPERNWKAGEVVDVEGKVNADFLEKVSDDTPHNHVLVVVSPLSLNNKINHG